MDNFQIAGAVVFVVFLVVAGYTLYKSRKSPKKFSGDEGQSPTYKRPKKL